MRLKMLALASLLVAGTASADIFDCGKTAPRRANASLAGVSHITVVGKAGTLKVTGRGGVREVTATGTACSDDSKILDQIQFRVRQNGSELRIEADVPEQSWSWFNSTSARLDMEVTVPDSLAIDVIDGSGEARIENVGALKVTDGSGGLTIKNVHGDAEVHDGSGEMTIRDVTGQVSIDDGSGEIEISGVSGNVTINDGSGSIMVRNVQRNVVVESDGSGSLDVADIRGDFTVESKGSGGVDYDRVTGRVSIPRRHR